MGKSPLIPPLPLTPPQSLLELFHPSPKIFTSGLFCNHLLLVYRQEAGKDHCKGEPHIKKAPALFYLLGDSAGILVHEGGPVSFITLVRAVGRGLDQVPASLPAGLHLLHGRSQ